MSIWIFGVYGVDTCSKFCVWCSRTNKFYGKILKLLGTIAQPISQNIPCIFAIRRGQNAKEKHTQRKFSHTHSHGVIRTYAKYAAYTLYLCCFWSALLMLCFCVCFCFCFYVLGFSHCIALFVVCRYGSSFVHLASFFFLGQFTHPCAFTNCVRISLRLPFISNSTIVISLICSSFFL